MVQAEPLRTRLLVPNSPFALSTQADQFFVQRVDEAVISPTPPSVFSADRLSLVSSLLLPRRDGIFGQRRL